MSLETLIIWIVVGLLAGWLASAMVGGGYGLLGDIVIGILGSFLGSWLFRELHLSLPLRGWLGTIFVAFVGAMLLLLILRLFRRRGR